MNVVRLNFPGKGVLTHPPLFWYVHVIRKDTKLQEHCTNFWRLISIINSFPSRCIKKNFPLLPPTPLPPHPPAPYTRYITSDTSEQLGPRRFRSGSSRSGPVHAWRSACPSLRSSGLSRRSEVHSFPRCSWAESENHRNIWAMNTLVSQIKEAPKGGFKFKIFPKVALALLHLQNVKGKKTSFPQ